MDRDLARKSPAVVIRAEPIRALARELGRTTAIVRANSRADLGLAVHRLWKAGRVEREYIERRRADRLWEATVTLIPQPTWWQRNRVRLLLAVVGAVATGAGLYALFLAFLAALPYILGGLALLVALTVFGGARTIINQNVTINR